jgi:hypothetical protein
MNHPQAGLAHEHSGDAADLSIRGISDAGDSGEPCASRAPNLQVGDRRARLRGLQERLKSL